MAVGVDSAVNWATTDLAWTARLNEAVTKVNLGGSLAAEVYEWAQWHDTVANPPHRHAYFEVCRVEGGHGDFVVDGRCHPIGAGDLLFARPGVRHQILSPQAPGIRLVWVAFDLAPNKRPDAPTPRNTTGRLDPAAPRNTDRNMARHWETVATAPAGPAGEDGVRDEIAQLWHEFRRADTAVVRDDGRIGAVWQALRAVGNGPRAPGQSGQLAGLAGALLLGLARAGAGGAENATPAPADRRARTIRNAIRYIHDNLDRPLRVDEVARHVHVSPRQLTRLFADGLGAPPASYVERARLDRAAALLVRTEQPIKQVAAGLGYPDVASFTRAFSRQHGLPPGRFRAERDLSGVLTAPPEITLAAGFVKAEAGTPKDEKAHR